MILKPLKKVRYHLLYFYYRYTSSYRILFEGKSDYSHIKVIQEGNKRQMIFIEQAGENRYEFTQTDRDLLDPLNLTMEYSRLMFASLLFFPDLSGINRILLVGLGGGTFNLFLKKYLPRTCLDIVEIDPLVGRLAREYFGFHESDTVRLFIEDGREYIKSTKKKYDLILFDPYLTDQPQEQLNTAALYRKINRILTAEGVFSGNLNLKSKNYWQEVEAISAAFGFSFLFTGKSNNSIMVGHNNSIGHDTQDDLLKAAEKLDKNYHFCFRPTELAGCLRKSFIFPSQALPGNSYP